MESKVLTEGSYLQRKVLASSGYIFPMDMYCSVNPIPFLYGIGLNSITLYLEVTVQASMGLLTFLSRRLSVTLMIILKARSLSRKRIESQ